MTPRGHPGGSTVGGSKQRARRWLHVSAVLLAGVPAAGVAQQPVSVVPASTRQVDGGAALAISPDGTVIAVAARRQVILLDAERLTVRLAIELARDATVLAVGPAGARIYIGDRGRYLHAFDAVTGGDLGTTRLDARPTALDVSDDGAFVAVGQADGRITVLTAELLEVRRHEAPDFHGREVTFVAWGQGGGELFGATGRGATAFWRSAAPAPIRSSSPNRAEVVAAARDFSGDVLAIGVKTVNLIRERGQMGAEAEYTVQVVDWQRGRDVAAIGLGARELRAVAVAPPRTAIATVDAEGELIVWDVGSGDRLATARVAPDVTRLAFSADGRMLAALAGSRLETWRATGLSAAAPRAAVDFARELGRQKFELTTEAAPLVAPAEGLRIAILGLAGLGADSVVARAADNLLASQVAGIPGVTLVEKDALDRVLREIRFQNSGITTADEAARIGSMLNASRVIVGSVSQLGSVVIISTRVIGVETGGVVGAREIRCNQCRPEDLPEAIRLLARTLFEH